MRRWLVPAALYSVLTVALTYPLLAHFTSTIPHDSGDPVLNTWLLWWSAQTLPLTTAWWNAPMFSPMTGAMALSEVLIGLLPITAIVQFLTHNPLAAYNTAWVLSFPLCGVAAYALALELTGRRDSALIAGLAFAFAPYRMGQLAHVQVLSYYWAPVALLGLHRFMRTQRSSDLAIFAVAWLLQALSNGYALFHLSVLVILWMIWFARPIRQTWKILAAWAIAAVPLIPILLTYRQIHSTLHLVRDINEIERFGVDIADVFSAPTEVIAWGSLLGPGRPETAIFPGMTLFVVAAFALISGWRGRSAGRAPASWDQRLLIAGSAVAALVAVSTLTIGPWRVGPLTVSDFHKPFSLAVGFRVLAFLRGAWVTRAWKDQSVVGFYVLALIAMYLLALGPEPRFFGRPMLYEPPYAWLMRLPGFDVLRVPARFAMLGVLCQSLLAAVAVARVPSATVRAAVAAAAVSLGLIVDGWSRVPLAAVAGEGPAWSDVASVIELPPGAPADFDALYRSMAHGRPIVNGYSSYYPPFYLPLVFAIRDHQYSSLYEVAAGKPLGIAVNRASPDAAAAEEVLNHMYGVGPGPTRDGWATFILYRKKTDPILQGPEIAIASVRANRHNEDVGRLRDRTVTTAWSAGPNQIGDEELVADLGSVQTVGSMTFRMGAYSFGFPRALAIQYSVDGTTWVPIWDGEPDAMTVQGAIADPAVVPITFDFGQVTTRYFKFTQIGSEPGIPWWIAELSAHAPATPASR